MAAAEASEPNSTAASDPPKSPPEILQDEQGEASAPFQKLPDLLCAQNGDDSSEDEGEKERQEKFKKYEAEFAQYLKNKYFSNKTFTGDNVFEEETKVENETIRLSRFPILSAFTNPAKYLQEKKIKMEASISNPTETRSSSPPTKKQQLAKKISL